MRDSTVRIPGEGSDFLIQSRTKSSNLLTHIHHFESLFNKFIRFEFLKAVNITVTLFWSVTPCSLAVINDTDSSMFIMCITSLLSTTWVRELLIHFTVLLAAELRT